MTPLSSRLDAGLIALCAAAFALCALLVAPVILEDGDLYWHIAAGRWMIDNQAVLRIDPFSSTFAGHGWQTQDWFAELALALAYVGAGWSAVLALTAVCAASAAGILAWCLARRLQGPILFGALVLALACSAGAILAGPVALALPFAVMWIAGLVQARAERRTPPFALLLVMVVWANLNASFLAGLVLLVLLAAEAVFEERLARAVQGWAVFTGAALIASMITPYGMEGFAHAVRHMQLPQTFVIRSLMPLLLAVPVAAAMVQHKAAPFRLAVLAGLLVPALQDETYRLLFAVSAPLLLAGLPGQEGLTRRMALKPLAVFSGLAIIAITVRLLVPLAREDGPVTPKSAFAQVPAALAHSAVLNDVTFGGYLIFHDVRPFIDSRSLYTETFRARTAQFGQSGPLQAALAKHRIRWTIFAPANPAAAAMDGLQGWHRLYADRWAVVHVRNGMP